MGFETLLEKHISRIFETLHVLQYHFIFLLSVPFTDIARARPDSHAPIDIISERKRNMEQTKQFSLHHQVMMRTKVDVGVVVNNLSL